MGLGQSRPGRPALSFATGFKSDQRFQRGGGPGLGAFGSPSARYFLRSFVTITNVRERGFSEKPNEKIFNVAFGIEYQTPWSRGQGVTNRVPSTTMVFVNASINLIKAFGKQGGS